MSTDTILASHNGFGTEIDFIETPSQMFELFVYEPEMLHVLTQNQLDPDTVSALAAQRYFLAGNTYMRQLLYACYDHYLHTEPNPDLRADKVLYTNLLNINPYTNYALAESFGHIGGSADDSDNYAAKYYSYLWSECISEYIYETQFKGKTGDSLISAGHRFRDLVMARGSSKPTADILYNYLGCEPDPKIFIQKLQ
jgi:thimet oligopeptidase